MAKPLQFGPDVLRDPGQCLTREWLETNGTGGFALSTITGANISRRFALTAMAAMSSRALAASRVPVMVELFTSEGCSSCPPADLLLGVLDEKQPVPGADIIVLSEHVDYWNYIGWTDPFSSAAYSRRQQEYAKRLGLDSVYTPQMVVDGRSQFVGSDERVATQTIMKAAEQPKLGLTVKREHGHLVISSASPFTSDVIVSVAFARHTAVSKVAGGENRGRELRHVSVASALVQAGQVKKNRTAELKIDARSQAEADQRVIAFAQDLTTGRIAAVTRL